jgi:hypothetical protein
MWFDEENNVTLSLTAPWLTGESMNVFSGFDRYQQIKHLVIKGPQNLFDEYDKMILLKSGKIESRKRDRSR